MHPAMLSWDIGPFMSEKIEAYFKTQNIPIMMRYFDPS